MDILQQLTAKKAQIKYENTRPDDAKDTHGDITKAKKILNYVPKTTIEEGLELTVKWYKEKFNK